MNKRKPPKRKRRGPRMRPLVINDEVRRGVERVKKYAEEHRRDLELVDRVQRGDLEECAGDIPGHVLHIPFGFRVVYSIEELGPFGWCQRLSASVDADASVLPHPEAFGELLSLFGIAPGLGDVDFVTTEQSDQWSAIVVSHMMDRALADELETDGKLPSKHQRELALKRAGLWFESLRDSRL